MLLGIKSPRRSVSAFICVSLFVASLSSLVTAQTAPSGADVFPETTAAWIEVQHPEKLIDKILNHPLAGQVQELDEFKQLIATPEFSQVMAVVSLGENQMGMSWQETIKMAAAKGLFFGLDSKTNGVAMLLHSNNEAKLKKLASMLVGFASEKGDVKRMDFRDAKVAIVDKTVLARFGPWFLISNNKELGKTIVNNLHDGTKNNLAGTSWFKTAAENSKRKGDIWSVVDLKTIRAAGVAKELFARKTNNPGVELVLGGILDALHKAPFATAELNFDKHLAFSTSLPFDKSWSHEARQYFYGESQKGVAPIALEPKNMIANLVSYRDIGEWWLSKEELFDENMIAQLAQAESQLTTIFSGMDFGQEVLGSLQPGAQIVVSQNKYQKQYVPDIKLPSFALVGKLKDPEKIQRRLKIAFQSVIGFANINLGMQGQPQLDLETEKVGESRVIAASYVYDEETDDGLMLFNFSPTMAFQGEHIIISSNRDLAVELASLAGKPATGTKSTANTKLDISGEQLCKILEDNRDTLIANNMIEKGLSRKESATEMDIVFKLMKFLGDSRLEFGVLEDKMKLDIEIEFANPKKNK